MATKSIIDIEIKDSAFKEFAALFAKYQAQLNSTKSAWESVGKETDKAKKSADEIAKNTKKASDAAKNAADAQKKFSIFSGTAVAATATIARNTASVAKNILNATASLLKWSGITAAFGGLLGIGGIWGLDRISESASNLRRQAKGAGVTSAELQASGASFGKYIDAEANLQRINEVRSDVSKRGALAAAGLGGLDSLSNADFQARALKAARSTFIRAGGTKQGAEAQGLLELFSFEELTRLKNTREDEIDANIKEYQMRKRMLELSDNQLKKWQDLNIQLDVAGRTIGNVLIDKLTPLAAPLTKLSESFANAVAGILGDNRMAGWIEGLGESIKKFAAYLKTPEFSNAIKSLWTSIKEVSDALVTLAKFIKDPFGSIGDGITNAIRDVDREPTTQNRGVSGKWEVTKPTAPNKTIQTPKPTQSPAWKMPPSSGVIVPAIEPPLSGFSANDKSAISNAAKPMKSEKKESNKPTTPQSSGGGSAAAVQRVPANAQTIRIENNTGGNAVVSFAAMAQ